LTSDRPPAGEVTTRHPHRRVLLDGHQYGVVREGGARVGDLCPVAVRQPLDAGYGSALLGFRPEVVGRQQRGQPVVERTGPARPADDGDLAVISHGASIT
jgi:hypothetical protein